jgi:mRNA-degrading endonuclease RelE of RelBE toxin-antitoxin system
VTYRVIIAPTAARQLPERLPKAVAWACFEFIRGPLSEDPRKVGIEPSDPFTASRACTLTLDLYHI